MSEVSANHPERQLHSKAVSQAIFRLFYEGQKITRLLEPVLIQNRLYWSNPSSGLIAGMVVEVQVEMVPGAELPTSMLPATGSSRMDGIVKQDELNRIYIDLE